MDAELSEVCLHSKREFSLVWSLQVDSHAPLFLQKHERLSKNGKAKYDPCNELELGEDLLKLTGLCDIFAQQIQTVNAASNKEPIVDCKQSPKEAFLHRRV